MHLNMSHHICQRFRPSKEIGSGKNPPANAGDMRDTGPSPGREDPLEKGVAIHSSILACEIP